MALMSTQAVRMRGIWGQGRGRGAGGGAGGVQALQIQTMHPDSCQGGCGMLHPAHPMTGPQTIRFAQIWI